MDWSLNEENQKKYDQVVADNQRLQKEFGIKPRTIEQRYQDYMAKKAEEDRRAEELKKLQNSIGIRRPAPKWKI